jgi:redox-sensing transcriptional repressor
VDERVDERGTGARRARGGVPDATIARLPLYHRVLGGLSERGVATVSSDALATAAGVGPAQLRRDLSLLGSYGTRGVGYDVDHLAAQVGHELGLTDEKPVVVVGVGNLGRALANYGGFASRGFRVAGLVDSDAQRVGEVVAGTAVRPVTELAELVGGGDLVIGIIATPAAAAQRVCDALVAAGCRSILNFAPVVLSVPADVDTRNVDLASELSILAFHDQRRVPAVQGVRA